MKKTVIALSVLAVSACGTVFSGSSQSLHFESNVKDVRVYANGALICSQMPCRADIDRASGALTIIAKADGYEDNIQQVKTRINPVSWGNLLSAYSWTTDFAMGSMWKYSQDGIYINMKKEKRYKVADAAFVKDSKIRHFAVHNYSALQLEATKGVKGEYLTALESLSGRDAAVLAEIVKEASTEGNLANNLTIIQ